MSTRTLDDWIALASSTSPRGQAFINGNYVDSASGETFTALNPATGTRLADVAACGEVDVDRAVSAAMVTREPLGVVAAIVPWNFPLNIAAWKIAPALAAGNSVVLKPAEQSSLSALVLGQLAVEAGMPPGVLNVVTGMGESTGQAIGRHMGIDCLTFTGSTLVGKRLMSYAAESNLKQVWLECGGKSANIVFADSENLETAADKACQGIFFNQGEVCSANSRLLVERDIKDEFLSLVIERAGRIRPGNPLDPASNLGAMAGKVHTDRVMAAIAAGRDDATLVLGGSRVSVGTSDCFVEPTVFNDVPNGAPIAQDEIFGPVLAVIGFDTEDDAVRLANESPYGIAASVWTDNLSRAHRVAGRLHVGTVSVNTVDAMSNQTPFGGVKQSGFGRDLSLHALNQYTALKTTWISY